MRKSNRLAVAATLSLLLASGSSAEPRQSRGQTVYVPVYSEVFVGNAGGRLLVRASIFVRNTDPKSSLEIRSAEYRNQDGALVRNLAEKPITVGPLATARFDVGETDAKGGPAPSLIVHWRAEELIQPPIVESMSVTAYSTQGISFVTRGQVIAER